MSFFLAKNFADEPNSIVPPKIRTYISDHSSMREADIRLDTTQMRLSSSFPRFPFHELFTQSPLQSADVADRLLSNVSKSSTQWETIIHNASILLDQRIGAVPPYPWDANRPSFEEFFFCLSCLSLQDPGSANPSWKQDVENKYQSLPLELQQFLSHVLHQITQSLPWMKVGRDSAVSMMPYETWGEIFSKKELDVHELTLIEQMILKANRKAIFRASAELGSVISSFLQRTDRSKSLSLSHSLTIPTPLGDIILASTTDDLHHLDRPPLLLIDCGGNDTYSGIYAKNDTDHPISILIDMGGKDTYQSDSEPYGTGCSFLGFSGLFDLGNEADRFIGKMRCFGYSLGGVSLFYDEAGDSTYNAESLCFGAGELGMAIFVDGGGDDRYESLTESQGYGGIGGFGFLLDVRGNDRYIASPTPVIHPSAQIPTQNFSASQGFGTGRFGPNLDGVSFPGGIGILQDRSGNDFYEASVFAQGSGYGYGIGILADHDGKDIYHSSWYALGSAAHQGCGIFFDYDGDDEYVTSYYMMGGTGTDFSLGVFNDLAGNDTYRARNASLGYGLTNSMGLFIDHGGEDRYSIQEGTGLGQAHNALQDSFRGLWPTWGCFFDLSGNDDYSGLSEWQNNRSWAVSEEGLTTPTFSMGWDHEGNSDQ